MAAGGAVAAAAQFLGSSDGPARIEWCGAPAAPGITKTAWFVRGGLPNGAQASLSLWVFGPAGLEARLEERSVSLDRDVVRWDVALSWPHPELVAGVYRYRVLADVGGRIVTGAVADYRVLPFTFGV